MAFATSLIASIFFAVLIVLTFRQKRRDPLVYFLMINFSIGCLICIFKTIEAAQAIDKHEALKQDIRNLLNRKK